MVSWEEGVQKLTLRPAAPCSASNPRSSCYWVPTRLRLGATTKDGRAGDGSATLMRILGTWQVSTDALTPPNSGFRWKKSADGPNRVRMILIHNRRPSSAGDPRHEILGLDHRSSKPITCLSCSFPLYPRQAASAAIQPRYRYRPSAPPTRGRERRGSR